MGTQHPDVGHLGTMTRRREDADFQAKILKLAKATGWLCYHTYDSRRSKPGFPDLVLVRGASMLFLEVKSEDGKAKPEQEAWIARLKQVKFVSAAICRPQNWDEIAEMLKGAAR
jgi:hypothetical protein